MTHRERRALDFIRGYQRVHGGVSPSLAEIAVALGGKPTAKAGAHEVLTSLERQKIITREHGRARSITILQPEPSQPSAPVRSSAETVDIPVFTLAQIPLHFARPAR
jgi:SOS-response transcriptional repressor LexA